MSKKCGHILTIRNIYEDSYIVNESIFSWQDWMLEDEVVAEEKKEVEQLNKNDMKTKKMTKEEAQEFVKNTKYIVWSEDESRKLQKKLFEIGCEWMDGRKEFYGTGQPFLHVDKHLFITFMRKDSYNNFATNSNQYKRTEDILNIKLEQEQTKTKFDPNTLQPFDKVLVRDCKDNIWRCNLFNCILEKKSLSYQCITQCWNYCIPYNGETKHLLGTNGEEPEFYRI